MFKSLIAVFIGIICLAYSAHFFVDGASNLARRLRLSALIIGVCVIGFGTSAPEIVVSVVASLEGSDEIALGNAVGSNIANIGFILALVMLYRPILIENNVLKRELPQLLLAYLIIFLSMWNLTFSRFDAIVGLLFFAGVMIWNIRADRQASIGVQEHTVSDQEVNTQALWLILLKVIGGLLFLIVSSRLLVWGAVNIAYSLGMSKLIVGLTVVAIGTSLPELASSLIAAKRGEHGLVIGNIVGSSFFNILLVIGAAGLVHPIDLKKEFLTRDFFVMVLFSVALLVFILLSKQPRRLSRFEGVLLLIAFSAYTAYLVMSSSR